MCRSTGLLQPPYDLKGVGRIDERPMKPMLSVLHIYFISKLILVNGVYMCSSTCYILT